MKVLVLAGGQNQGEASINKALGSLVFCTTALAENIANEEVSVMIEKQHGSNIDITEGFIPLKYFLAGASYGSDAVTYFKDTALTTWETSCVVELAESGYVEMGPQDRLVVKLRGLDIAQKYQILGHEEPMPSKEVFMYRQRIVPADQNIYDVDVDNYDVMVIGVNADVTEVNFTHDNGVTTNHDFDVLMAMSQDLDPVAIVKSTGTVKSGWPGLLQFPVSDIRKVEFRKGGNSVVRMLLRKDVELASAATF